MSIYIVVYIDEKFYVANLILKNVYKLLKYTIFIILNSFTSHVKTFSDKILNLLDTTHIVSRSFS